MILPREPSLGGKGFNIAAEENTPFQTAAVLTPLQRVKLPAKEHPFLKGMSPHDQTVLGDWSQPAHFEAGESIFREGDPADRFYLIQKGAVALEGYEKGKGLVVIQTVGAGDVLGWSWLFPPCFWHFTARAIEATEAIFIEGTLLREACESDHDLGYEILKRLAAVMLEQLQASRRPLLEPPDLPSAAVEVKAG